MPLEPLKRVDHLQRILKHIYRLKGMSYFVAPPVQEV